MTEVTLSADVVRQALTSDRLHLIVLPTEACNFRCVYCYEDFRLRRMEPHVVEGIKRLLERRMPGLQRLELSWFGGEPLLASDIVEDVMLHVRRLREARPGVDVIGGMTTNGYLLDADTLQRLAGLGVREYQITFDGPRPWHDRKRLRADGSGSFDRIWNNLTAIASTGADCEITVRLHVDAENHHDIPVFLEQYRAAFGGDRRFSLFVRRVGRFGGANDDALPLLEGEAATAVLDGLRSHVRDLGLRARFEGDACVMCYAAMANSLVVRADGRLNKCTVALEHPRNQVGRIDADGELELESEPIQAFLRGLFSKRLEELQCPMRGLKGLAEVGGNA